MLGRIRAEHERPAAAEAVNLHQAIGSGPRRESEGLIVPSKPAKAGGGKEPWFWSAFEEGESQEIGVRHEAVFNQ